MLLELVHFVSTLLLTGLIWTIQVAHYPAFVFVDSIRSVSHAHFHQRAITYIVLPLMVVELLSGVVLWARSPDDMVMLFLLLSIFLIWLSTFCLSVPLHGRLARGEADDKTIARLVLTNWPRTLLWSLRSLILIWQVGPLEF